MKILFDTSALLKRYLPEDGRKDLLALVAQASPMRSMHALHVGAAMATGVDLFVTADIRQFNGAQAFGLKPTLLHNVKCAA